MSTINEIIEYADEAFSPTNISEARAELTRLQAIAEAAELMAKSLQGFKELRQSYEYENLAKVKPAVLFDDVDAAALAAYEKAKAG